MIVYYPSGQATEHFHIHPDPSNFHFSAADQDVAMLPGRSSVCYVCIAESLYRARFARRTFSYIFTIGHAEQGKRYTAKPCVHNELPDIFWSGMLLPYQFQS